MADSVPGSTSSTVTVTVGTPLNGTIETPYEEDWYRVSLTTGVTYTIRVMGRGTGSNTLEDPVIQGIFNGSNNYVGGFNNDGLISGPYGRDAMTTFRPTSSGNYWIAVAGDLGTTGTFTVSVVNSSGSTDTVPANTSTTATVAVGASVTGTIDSANDVDWYKVSFVAGTTYTIRMRGATSGFGTLADPVIAGIFNNSGAYITNTYVDDFGTRDALLTFVAPYTGTYYIAADGWGIQTGTFTLDVAVANPDVAGNTSTTATLAIGASTTVLMDQPYDHDWYRVTLTAGRTYEFALAGTGSNNTPGIHGIYNSAGSYVGGYAAAILGPGSATATTMFTPTASGTYYIDAYSIYQGSYTLSARQVADDVPADRSTTATVAVGGSVVSDIGGATDVDWFKVVLVGGTSYVITMRGAQSGSGTLEDPIIAGIYDAAGVLVSGTFADDTDSNEASLVFRAPASGTYYIAADGYAGYTGTYRLSVTTLPGDAGHTPATAGNLTLNTPVTVSIDTPADVDWYAVTLNGGSTYGIRLLGASTNRGTLYDPVLLGVFDSNGARVANTFVDDARGLLDAILTFTPATTGTYYIAADGYDRFTGTARLSVTIDNVGSTNGDAGTLIAGTPLEGVIDFAGDVDRYKVELDANSTYYIRMLGLHSRNGDLADPHISGVFLGTSNTNSGTAITDAAGTNIIGTNAWVRVTTGVSRELYFIATSGNANTDGAYLLTAEKDIPGSQASTETITVGGPSVTGYIDEGTDADWFVVTLTGGVPYVIKMQGAQYGNGTLIDPVLNGLRLSSTPATIITGTSGTGIDNNDGRDSVVRIFLSGTATNTYYIAAQSAGSTVGSYRISVGTEIGETAATSAVLLASGATSGSVVGTIDDTTDTDWYAITVAANTSYVFKMLGVDSGKGTLDDPVIASIVNSGGSAQLGVTINAAGLDSFARWIPGTPGTYYIRATGAGADTGTFTLVALAEVGHTVATASSITVGNSVIGEIDAPVDSDWYGVTLAANTSYVFKMQGADSGGGTLGAAVIGGIMTSGGATQTGVTITSAGSDSYAYWTTTAVTTVYVNATSSGRNMGTFTLSVLTEVGNTATTASSLSAGGFVNGAIDGAGDSDWYAITLAANTAYVFKMEGVDSGRGTLGGAAVSIVGSTGTAQTGVILTSAGSDAYARWITGTSDITVYVNATGTGTNLGTYRLSAATEIGHTAATASSVSVGGPVTGTIDVAGDSDWYGITVTANTSYIFKMQGVDSGLGTLGGAAIGGILDAAGAAQNNVTIASAGSDSYARWVSGAAGTFYINATGSGTNMGTFRLSVATDVGHTTGTAASFTLASPASGTIDMPNDSDWYGISLAANTAYIFRMQGVDGVAIGGIMNSTGVAQSDVTVSSFDTNSYARWVSGAAGTYYVNATGANIGSFTLRALTGDVGHTTGTAGSFTLASPASGTLDMPNDSDWYAISLTVNVAYLFRMQGVDGVAIGGIFNSSGVAQNGVIISSSGTESYATWIAAATTTYYVSASGANIGAFTLSAATEIGNTTASYGTITVGGTANGTIDLPDDVDWYRIALGHSTSYVFRISGVSSNGGTLEDPHLVLRNPSGNVVSTGIVTEHGTDTIIRFTTTASGTANAGGNWFLEAQGNGAAGTFTLSAAQEPGTSSTTAGSITIGTPFVGMIEDSSDADWYAFTVTANTPYVFRMLGADSGGGTLGGAVITSIVASGGAVQSGVSIVNSGSDAYATWTPSAAGTFYLNVTASGTNYGSFTLISGTDAVGTTATSSASLALNGTVNGTIDVPGDNDWYAITVTAHTPYVFRMLGADSGGGTLAGAAITGIVTSAGAAQTGVSIVNTGSDSYATWTPAAAGTFYVVVTGTGTNSGTFRLTSGTDAVGTTTTSAVILPINGSVNGVIDVPGDNDWYSIAVTANTAYFFKMEGVDSGGGTLGGAGITIVNSSGAVQGNVSTVTIGSDVYARWIPTTSTTFYVNATGADAHTGTFKLSAATEVGNTTSSYGTIAVGGTASGTIDMPGDSDWYRITLASNTTYVFRISGASSGGGTLADPHIALLNSTGGAVGSVITSEYGTDTILRYTTGSLFNTTFHIDAQGNGGTGTFTLTAAIDRGATTGSAQALTLGTPATGTIDYSGDTDWYSVALVNNASYVFTMRGVSSNGGSLADPHIVFRNSAGTEVTSGVIISENGTDAIVRFATSATNGATYYLDAQGNGTIGTFTINAVREAGDTNATALALTVGTSVIGELSDTADVDRYSVSLTANTTYRIRMEGLDSGNGTLADPWINGVRNAAGTVFVDPTEGGGTGKDAWVTFRPTTTTTYYIDADTSAAIVGTYKLTVEIV